MADQQPPLKDPALMTPEEIAAETAEIDAARDWTIAESSFDRNDLQQKIDADYKEFQREQKYADRPVAATAAALASGLSFSLSDRALIKTGLVDQETLAGLSEFNPAADIVGQVTGAIAPAIITGGGSLVAQGGVQAAKLGAKEAIKAGAKKALANSAPGLAERGALAVERSVLKALSEGAAQTGQKKIVQEIIKKSVAKGAGSAVEGAAWGANQLLREDAIGTAELNAENLAAYMGEGGLVGGTFGAMLVPGGAALRSLGGGLAKGIKKAGSYVGDPIRDSAKLMDLAPAQIAKFQEKNPKFLEGLPDFLRTKVGLKWNDTADSLVTKLDNLESSAITRIDDAIEELDKKMFDKNIGIGPGVYEDVAAQLEREFVEPYKHMKSMDNFSNKAKELVDDFRMKSNDTKLELRRLDFKEIRDMRIKMDKLAKGFYKSMDPSDAAKAAFRARDLLKNVLVKYADSVDPKLGQKFADANLDYHYAATLKPRLSTKAEKARDFVNFRDMLLGGIGVELGGVTGLSLAAANKLMNSDLKRKLVILGAVEKGAQTAASKISSAASNFVNKTSKPAKLASTGILVRSALAQEEGKEAPKKRAEAFRNIQNNVVKLAANPAALYDRSVKSTHILAMGAPQTAQAMMATMNRAVQFLARKAPKDARDIGMPIFEPKYEPSQMELSKFERYMQVIEQPLSTLEDLERGTLTRDHVEALKAVYPNLYNNMRAEVLKQAESNPNLSYNKRIQMGILMDLPTDSSLSPQFIVQMQQNFVPPEQRQDQMQANGVPASGGLVQPTAGGAQKLASADRSQTPSQSVAAKGVGGS
jgi:hypothetical protein